MASGVSHKQSRTARDLLETEKPNLFMVRTFLLVSLNDFALPCLILDDLLSRSVIVKCLGKISNMIMCVLAKYISNISIFINIVSKFLGFIQMLLCKPNLC